MSALLRTSTSELVDMVQPVNLFHPLNRGLVGRWRCLPGLTGGSKLLNIFRADKDGHHGTLTNGPTWGASLGRQGGLGSLSFDGSDDHIAIATAPVTVLPITMVCWFRAGNITADHVLVSLARSGSNNGYYFLRANGASAGDKVQATQGQDSGTDATAISLAGFSANTWHHAAAVFTSTTSRNAYLDLGTDGANTTSILEPSVNRSGIGVLYRQTLYGYALAQIDDVMVFNRALSVSELAQLREATSRRDDPTLNWMRRVTYSFDAGGAAATTARAKYFPLLGAA